MSKPVIICIDDEVTILNSLKIELRAALGSEYMIETAEGGADALELIAELITDKYQIPLVICDYIMPEIKGDKLLKQIHTISPKTLKIMLTGQADLAAVGNAIKYARLYRYMAKPWQTEDLKLTVKEAVHSYFLEQQLAEQNAKLQSMNQKLETLVKERTAALSLSEEKFAKAFRSSPNPITITRLSDGSHVEVNHAFCQMIGYTTEEVIGRTALELNIWVNLADRIRLFNSLKQKGNIRNFEFDFCPKKGGIKTALLAAEIIEINEEICVISVSQDISDRKQAELALQQAKEAADQANRAKSEFLSNMSHELRTPLNAILGFTQLLLRDPSLKPAQQEHLGIINRSGEHLLQLINNILQMSKIEVGRITVDNNTFDLYHLLNSLDEMLQLPAHKKGLQLIFDGEPNLPQYVQTDEGKLRQVLINLLGNAIKFTTEGGVTLRVKWVKKEGDISAHCLYFEVEDTGAGIAADEIDNLFKPFMQTETGRRSQEGTGLGLPISRQFVQLMGGDITVSSTLGKGTILKFNIGINIADESQMQTKQIIRRAIGLEAGQPEYRILVVDDRLESRLLLVKLLSSLGFSVQQAENGAQAVELWSTWEPHLIWMDMRMPVMDGYEATKRIKAHLKGQATIIIALTASVFEEERSVILSTGCDDFVAKPFREQVILDKMAQYLGVRYVYEQPNSSGSEKEKPYSQSSLSGGEMLGTKIDSSYILAPSSLQVMPHEWIEELYQAADCVDNEQIFALLKQIPAEYAALGQALSDLVNNFRCDKIIDLIEETRN